jgi:acetyl esterase/lipase
MYSPKKEGLVPVHFNMHGGGWVLGSLSSEQAWCRSICNNVGIKVADIDYRLGPEFKFPIAIYDCWATIKHVRRAKADLSRRSR